MTKAALLMLSDEIGSATPSLVGELVAGLCIRWCYHPEIWLRVAALEYARRVEHELINICLRSFTYPLSIQGYTFMRAGSGHKCRCIWRLEASLADLGRTVDSL